MIDPAGIARPDHAPIPPHRAHAMPAQAPQTAPSELDPTGLHPAALYPVAIYPAARNRAPQATWVRLLALGCQLLLAALPLTSASAQDLDGDGDLRLNQIQVIGSHNSYHIAPEPELLKMIALSGQRVADSIDYTHPALTDQLEQGLRQFELDIYADPTGGRFAAPLGYQMLRDADKDPQYVPNRDGQLDRPGLKIIHEPNFDYATRNETFLGALQEIDTWSAQNPDHLPILVLVELKEKSAVASPVKLLPFDQEQLQQVDTEIRQAISPTRLLTPDDLRGDFDTLRAALQTRGWPRLADCRGKIFFALDNEGALMERYLEDHPSLRGRAMLASVAPEHPAAAFRKLNDPERQFEEIQRSVRGGLIVRTRADANTTQARNNDPTQRDRALATGAQFVSTDYWNADPRLSSYQVRFSQDRFARRNPLVQPEEKR